MTDLLRHQAAFQAQHIMQMQMDQTVADSRIAFCCLPRAFWLKLE